MGITVKISGGNQDFELLSEGVHPAVLADIIDLGIKDTAYGPKHKLQFVYITEEKDTNGKAKYAFERVNKPNTLHEKAGLTKIVKALLGKLPEGEDFVVDSLIGKYSNLVIQHSEENEKGKIYANIVGRMKPTKRVAVPADFVRNKDKQQNGNGKPANTVQAAGGGRAAAAAVLAPPVESDVITDEDIPF